MKISKILAASAAAVVAAASISSVSFAASAMVDLQPGEAMLGFGDSEWKAAGWGKGEENALDMSYFQTAQITGNGTYSVGIDLSAGYVNLVGIEDEETGELAEYTTGNGIGAMGINVNFDSEDEAYNNFGIKVTSVKFDGVETMIAGATSYTNNEDGGKRCNVLNPWVNYDATKEDHITLDPDTATAVLTDFSGEWSTCVVEFEVYGLAEDAAGNGGSEAGNDVVDAGNTTTDDKTSPDTGVEGIAVVAGVAVLAAGAVLVSKKRK